jgi:hypothetical protein
MRPDIPPDGRFRLDFTTVLVLALVVLLLFWMTSELWLPHWGPE